MTNTEVVNAKADSYAVTRDWCGDGSAQFTRRDTGNSFSGQWHCGETNQYPCGGVECDEENTCCDHQYFFPGEDE